LAELNRESFPLSGYTIAPGERRIVSLTAGHLYDTTEMNIPIMVVHGREPGPTLFVSAALHGDEVNGVEIVKRVIRSRRLKRIKGTLIAVPIVNVYGFNARSRYLPDRRDLNRCFPGLEKGSLASRLAYAFMTEIVQKSTHGIDLHTGSAHRFNLPQIRASLNNRETLRLAQAFEVPVLLNSSLRDGSLRQAASDLDIPMLLFEGGEALRFDEKVIRAGVRGVLNVMSEIGMISTHRKKEESQGNSYIAKSSFWIRAPESGMVRGLRHIGRLVERDEVLAEVSDPFGVHRTPVKANRSGLIIGQNVLPYTNRGDALYHIASFDNEESLEESLGDFDEYLEQKIEENS
jgi:hypothetical protein